MVQSFGAQTAKSDEGNASKHHHAPEPVAVRGKIAQGMLQIVDTPQGERMQFSAKHAVVGLMAAVRIERDAGQVETLALNASRDDPAKFISTAAPQEPHTFQGDLVLNVGERSETVPFRVVGPDDHH
jgi:hypothetical protein